MQFAPQGIEWEMLTMASILIVDDSLACRNATAALLRAEGHQVNSADNAWRADDSGVDADRSGDFGFGVARSERLGVFEGCWEWEASVAAGDCGQRDG